MKAAILTCALLAASASSVVGAPLLCKNFVAQFDAAREELGQPFGMEFGQDVLEDWRPGEEDHRFAVDQDKQVEARLVCAADGLFYRFSVTAAWVGEPDVGDWMLAQTPADVATLAILGELGPKLPDLLNEALAAFSANRQAGFGEASKAIDDTFEAAVRFEVAGTLQQITYSIRRSEIE